MELDAQPKGKLTADSSVTGAAGRKRVQHPRAYLRAQAAPVPASPAGGAELAEVQHRPAWVPQLHRALVPLLPARPGCARHSITLGDPLAPSHPPSDRTLLPRAGQGAPGAPSGPGGGGRPPGAGPRRRGGRRATRSRGLGGRPRAAAVPGLPPGRPRRAGLGRPPVTGPSAPRGDAALEVARPQSGTGAAPRAAAPRCPPPRCPPGSRPSRPRPGPRGARRRKGRARGLRLRDRHRG